MNNMKKQISNLLFTAFFSGLITHIVFFVAMKDVCKQVNGLYSWTLSGGECSFTLERTIQTTVNVIAPEDGKYEVKWNRQPRFLVSTFKAFVNFSIPTFH